MASLPTDINERVACAVAHYWNTREKQAERQVAAGHSDQGARRAVTGGAQMDEFINLFTYLILSAGIKSESIFQNRRIELPGFFRPTKEWDLLVVQDGQLILALEAKSQVGPSFGNNFNNRTEEAMGSALDLWTAYREGAFNKTTQPWLGYLFLLEDCPGSRRPVRIEEPHFKVFPEFVNASYTKRYELFCRKLVRERHYNAAAFLTADSKTGIKGVYQELAEDCAFAQFALSLIAHSSSYGVT
jgi:hypothetical protein